MQSQQNQDSNQLVSSLPNTEPLAVAVPIAQQGQPVMTNALPINSLTAQRSVLIAKSWVQKIPNWLFFYGFVSIFLINFVNAIVDSKSFISLLSQNIFVPSFLPAHFLVDIAAANDLALGVLILTKWKRKWIYGWAGAWLLIVALIKAGHFLV